jgi:glycosyltransferase involved in cell wall biosynthesis
MSRSSLGKRQNLLIISAHHRASPPDNVLSEFNGEPFATVTNEEFATHLTTFLWHFRRYKHAVLFTHNMEFAPRMSVWHGFLWWIGRTRAVIDSTGRKVRPTFLSLIGRGLPQMALELVRIPSLLRRVAKDLRTIQRKTPASFPDNPSIVYLRTDLWFGIRSGGYVTHISGVANSFCDLGIPLFFLSTDRLELINESKTPLFKVNPKAAIQNIPGAQELAYNRRMIEAANRIFRERKPSIIYQRYSPYNYSGAYLATKWRLPFVLEYNGSEVWIAKNWGTRLHFVEWAMEIETLNMNAADAIVVVSQPLKDELISRGVSSRKILVNPNGVDTSRFDPAEVENESLQLRKRLGLESKIVVGFAGTFGPWHGVEVLARAIRPVIEREPRVFFLFVGDGVSAHNVRAIIRETGVEHAAALTGMIPAPEVPPYIATCDILVSPHIPNSDGSPFFGSPTKLFEYMAMARPIVASRLNQIAEILKDGHSGLLVSPGDVNQLATAILELAADPSKRVELGRKAREEALAHHTWLAHTKRILEHLRSLQKASPSP